MRERDSRDFTTIDSHKFSSGFVPELYFAPQLCVTPELHSVVVQVESRPQEPVMRRRSPSLFSLLFTFRSAGAQRRGRLRTPYVLVAKEDDTELQDVGERQSEV